jgi:glycosyltransferase involved in cell wall biosynthesis
LGADEANHGARIAGVAERRGVSSRLHFLGQLDGDELQMVYSSMDLVALPSYGESFGNTAVEALAQGTEVFVSRTVPVGDYVAEHGLGTVVDGPDPEDWGLALTRWTERESGFDPDRASDRVREDFDIERGGRRLLEIYARLADGKDVEMPAARPEAVR